MQDRNFHRIHLHHIGGRDGEVGGFPLNPRFRDDVHLHIYEGDPSCIPQIEEVNDARQYRFTIHECLLADEERNVELHVTRDPCGSSLRRPLHLQDGTYIKHPLLGDYVLDEVFRPCRKIAGKSTTIDAMATKLGDPVDVLSIDTQGTEDMVLAGAKGQLRAHTIAIVAEVCFREIYAGQPLFGDICRLLGNEGFEFIRFQDGRGDDTSRFRGPIGWRGRAGAAFDDALFFRSPDHIMAEAVEPTSALLKLAYIALCHGHVELTVECVRRASARDDFERTSSLLPYQQFLLELLQLHEKEEHVWMARFSELFDETESSARFERDILHHWNIYSTIEARRRYFTSNDRMVFCRRVPELLREDLSPFERLLCSNGFELQASEVAARRRRDTEALARMLHLLHFREPVEALHLGEVCGPELENHVCPVRRRSRE